MKKEEIYLDLSKLSSEQIKNVGKVLKDNDEKIYKNTLIDLENGNNDVMYNNLLFDSEDSYLFWSQANKDSYRLKYITEITYNEFLSLFEKDNQKEWQPKQGDKVLVSNDSSN